MHHKIVTTFTFITNIITRLCVKMFILEINVQYNILFVKEHHFYPFIFRKWSLFAMFPAVNITLLMHILFAIKNNKVFFVKIINLTPFIN